MTVTAIAPTQANVLAAMRSFLTAVLPSTVQIIAGQPNRVPGPSQPRYVVMWPPNFVRLETNVDSASDVLFTGSIAGEVLTVTAAGTPPATFGVILPGSALFGVGVASNTIIGNQLTGPAGGTGTYAVTPSQTVSSGVLSSGGKTLMTPSDAVIQLDFHAADGTAGDLAATVASMFRDEYASDQFANQDPNYGVAPLYADDPKQAPWQNDQQQIEWRWILEAHVQVNQIVSVSQEYASAADITLVSVDAQYPG